MWYTARYTRRRACVTPNFTRSTKLRGAQHSPELAFRSTNLFVPENLIFPALGDLKGWWFEHAMSVFGLLISAPRMRLV